MGFFAIACTQTTKEKNENMSFSNHRLPTSEQNRESVVFFEILEKTQKEVIIKLNNNSESPIYVIYESKAYSDFYSTQYLLTCNKINEISKMYSPEWHASGSRKELASSDSIKFKVTSLPSFNGVCEVKLRYFDNPEAVKILNKFFDENFVKYTSKEEQIIEKSKKDVRISFNIRRD
jgi:hypothetical protein